MVTFDWKLTKNDEYPPEPAQTKDFWKYVDPGMTTIEVMDWYSTVFEMYACRMVGQVGPVPAQLYYIGNREWMNDQGHVFPDGNVEAWDSYTEE